MTIENFADFDDAKDLVARLQQQITSISSNSAAGKDALTRATTENEHLQRKLKDLGEEQRDTRAKCLQYQELVHSAKSECEFMKTEMEQYKTTTQEMLARTNELITSKVRAAVSKAETQNQALKDELSAQKQHVQKVEAGAKEIVLKSQSEADAVTERAAAEQNLLEKEISLLKTEFESVKAQYEERYTAWDELRQGLNDTIARAAKETEDLQS